MSVAYAAVFELPLESMAQKAQLSQTDRAICLLLLNISLSHSVLFEMTPLSMACVSRLCENIHVTTELVMSTPY